MKKTILSILALLLVCTMLLVSCTSGTGDNTSSDSYATSSSVDSSNESKDTTSNGSDSVSNSNASLDGPNSNSNASNSNASNGSVSDASQDEPDPDTSSSNGEASTSTPATSGSNSNSNASNGNEVSNGSNGNASNGSNSGSNASQGSNSNSNGTVSNTGNQEHRHQYSKIVVPPTCTEQGYTKYICDTCRDNYVSDYTAKVKHNMLYDWDIAPTQTTRGKQSMKCSYGCGHTETTEYYSYEELSKLISEYTVQYINEYRVAEGKPKLTVSKKITEFTEYRAKQALQGPEHWSHNSADSSLAAEAVKFGKFVDFTDIDVFGNTVTPYWASDGKESYGYYDHGFNGIAVVGDTSLAKSTAKAMVDSCHASSGHWAYVGAANSKYADYLYVGVGTTINGQGRLNRYIVVCDYNPDVKGYLHITMDKNGNLHEEWVKP